MKKHNLLKTIPLSLTIILIPSYFASAQTCDIYVSTSGADSASCGTQSSPCRHIEYAVEQRAISGQTVCVNDGTYSENTISFPLGVSLTAVNQVYPNPTVKISAASEITSILDLVSSPPVKNGNHEISYIDINGSLFAPQYGIRVTDRNNIHIHHCYLHDHIDQWEYTRAIKITSSEADAYESNDWSLLVPYDGRNLDDWHAKWTFTPVENIEIEHCTIIDWGRTPIDGRAGGGGIMPKGWKNGSIHDCYFEATDPSYYIKFIQATPGAIENVDIYNNVIQSHNSGAAGSVWSVEIWLHINTKLYNNNVNLPFSWTYGYGSEVFNNTLVVEDYKSVGIEGIGQSNYKVYNNFVSVGASGINCGHGKYGNLNHIIGNVEIFNNVVQKVWYKTVAVKGDNAGLHDKQLYNVKVYSNTADAISHYGEYVRITNTGGGTMLVDGVEFKNNLVINAVEEGGRYYNDGGGGVLQNYVVDHNMYYNCGTNGFTGLTETNKLVADPLFVGGANPDVNDYKLQSNSPAIDAGISTAPTVTDDYWGTPRPQGSAYDIGAYESAASSCVESWTCSAWSAWSECVSNRQSRTRTCTDQNNCGTATNKPAESESQSCESPTTYGISNFIQLVADWLKSETGLTSDINNDGVVNARDLGIMMSNWGG